MFNVPFMLLTDIYKVDHRRQYPPGTTFVFSNMTARNGRDPEDTGIIFFGLQAAVQHYLIDYVKETFFDRDVDEVCNEYGTAMLEALGPNGIGTQHIRELHELGYLPLEIRALQEGTFVPYGVPCLTVENTLEMGFWVTNYIETLLSSALWQACTSATKAFQFRVLMEDWAERTGSPKEFVDWQGHDFSFRGMSSPESAILSGMGHLTSFTGTDTIPAIAAAKYYYDATGLVGGSVAATEHSVMCAGGKEDELETYSRLLDLYPEGILSVVSDTWDLWHVIKIILPQLKDKIMARNGKLVIRPDSGDPVKIICGDPDAADPRPHVGVVQLLWDIFGGTETETGHQVLDSHIGVIYGDSINIDRCNRIGEGLAEKGFAFQPVFGIGSFTYQLNTRDTHGFAMKATWSKVGEAEHMLFKDPATGDGSKKSARGRLVVCRESDEYVLHDGLDWAGWSAVMDDDLDIVYRNGKAYNRLTLEDVRSNVRAEVAKRRQLQGAVQ